jgi:hypothetical protein
MKGLLSLTPPCGIGHPSRSRMLGQSCDHRVVFRRSLGAARPQHANPLRWALRLTRGQPGMLRSPVKTSNWHTNRLEEVINGFRSIWQPQA